MVFSLLSNLTKIKLCKLNSVVKAGLASALVIASQPTLAHDDLDVYEQVVDTIAHGSLAQVKQLIADGLDVNQDLNNDGTPLIIAVQKGNRQTIEYLVSVGADVNLKSETDGSPLIAAALTNNLALVEYFYEVGADIDAVTEHDETALISASHSGHFKVVKYLVEKGADVNLAVEANTVRGTELRSPLLSAKTREIREYLIAQGASK